MSKITVRRNMETEAWECDNPRCANWYPAATGLVFADGKEADQKVQMEAIKAGWIGLNDVRDLRRQWWAITSWFCSWKCVREWLQSPDFLGHLDGQDR